MPVLRLPLILNTEPRSATQDKDSLLVNAFTDKSESGVVYVTKRPGLAVGAEGITTGTNRGVFFNPYDGDFYYIDDDTLPAAVTFSPPIEQDWQAIGIGIPTTSGEVVGPELTAYEINNNWYQAKAFESSFSNYNFELTQANLTTDTPWTPAGTTTVNFSPFYPNFFLNFGDEIYASSGWGTVAYRTTNGVDWAIVPGSYADPDFFGSNNIINPGGTGSDCVPSNHNYFKKAGIYYSLRLDTTDDVVFTYTTDFSASSYSASPIGTAMGLPSGRNIVTGCLFNGTCILYLQGSPTTTLDVYSSTDFVTFTFQATLPVGARFNSNSVVMGGSLYYSVRPTQTEARQVYKSNGSDLTSWSLLQTNDPRGYTLTKVGSVLHSIFFRGVEGNPLTCVVDTYKYD